MKLPDSFVPWTEFLARMELYVRLANKYLKLKPNQPTFDLEIKKSISQGKEDDQFHLRVALIDTQTRREIFLIKWNVQIHDGDVYKAARFAMEHVENSLLGQAMSMYLKKISDYDPLV